MDSELSSEEAAALFDQAAQAGARRASTPDGDGGSEARASAEEGASLPEGGPATDAKTGADAGAAGDAKAGAGGDAELRVDTADLAGVLVGCHREGELQR